MGKGLNLLPNNGAGLLALHDNTPRESFCQGTAPPACVEQTADKNISYPLMYLTLTVSQRPE